MQVSADHPKRRIFSAFFENMFLLFVMAFIAWAIEIVDFFVGGMLDRGIVPRDPDSLMGIVTAHWLHGSFPHIISNTVPFLMLGGFVLLGGRALFWKVSICIALLGGGLLWLFGSYGNHFGASLVIFGYLGFLLTRGIFEKSALWISISVITVVLYGGLLFGMLPGQANVSWDGHLFGFVAGIVAAKTLVPRNKTIYQPVPGVVPPPLPGNRG